MTVQSQAVESETVDAASARGDAHVERCGNCGATLAGRYCGQCGEKRPDAHDYALAGIFHEALHSFTHLDGKIARSVVSLLRRPGELTEAYFSGRRGRFTRPLALFVTLNLVFFFIVPHTGLFRESYDEYARFPAAQGSPPPRVRTLLAHAAASGLPPAVYRERFDEHLAAYKKSLLLYLIPVFGLASFVVHATGGRRRRRRFVAEDIVHAIHTTTFFIVVSIFVFMPVTLVLLLLLESLRATVPAAGVIARLLDSNAGTGLLYCSALGWYLVSAERRFYRAGWPGALARGAVLLFLFFGLMWAFRAALFWVTLWTT